MFVAPNFHLGFQKPMILGICFSYIVMHLAKYLSIMSHRPHQLTRRELRDKERRGQDWTIGYMTSSIFGEQGWRSGESIRLTPMWPGFDSRTPRHMRVEFVVGSRPCALRKKATFPKSNPTWNARSCLNEFLESPLVYRG